MFKIKKDIALILSICLIFGLFVSTVPMAHAGYDGEIKESMKTSQNGIDFIKSVEGFCQYPYYDYGQYTVGYGTRCPADKYTYYKENGITREEAEELLKTFLEYTESEINKKIIDKYGLTMTQGQFDALVSFSLNIGTSWMSSNKISLLKNTIINKDSTPDEITYAFSLYCKAGGDILSGLVTRRLCEANMYINEEYNKTRDPRFGYVYYEPNGGELEYKIQGFQVGNASKPIVDPILEGHEFLGWYTKNNGGMKVDALHIENVGKTLYARWEKDIDNWPNESDESNSNESTAEPSEPPISYFEPIKITVTGNNVNIRSGPGTNYDRVGKANIGDKFIITQTESCTGYQWGESEKGWICLKYTDYDKEEQDCNPDVEVEETLPENKENGTTSDPSQSEENGEKNDESAETPEVPESQPSDPKLPEDDVNNDSSNDGETDEKNDEDQNEQNVITGTVDVDDVLRVRSGPGTKYSIVGYLYNAKKVEIYDQEVVGDMNWGKIGDGKWISLTYVVLDNQVGGDGNDVNIGESNRDDNESNNSNVSISGVITADCLRVRQNAGTSYGVVGYLYQGNKVKIKEQKIVDGKTWGRIDNGWISMNYVNVNESGPDISESDGSENEARIITADCLRIRNGAGTNSKIVGYLYMGEKVKILETKMVDGNEWGRIDRGWISMKYVK